MTQEEKAKAYDEALERAKIWQEHLNETGDKDYADELNYIFPELKESRNEKVRKWLYGYFRSCFPVWIHPDITCEEILNWLENIPYTIDHEKREGFHLGYKAGLEKQGEQKSIDWDKQIKYNPNAPSIIEEKSAWSEEDDMMLEGVLDKIGDLGTGVMCKGWLKSLKNRIKGE